MGQKQIDPDTMKEMLKAAEGMGIAEGQQNFKSSVMEAQLVDFFPRIFAEWIFQGGHLVVHVFPRAGRLDAFKPGHYAGQTYIPGRLEKPSPKVQFGPKVEGYVKEAADMVTFDDVELGFVQELGAWAIRFCNAASQRSEWVGKEGCLLEVFLTHLNLLLEQNIDSQSN